MLRARVCLTQCNILYDFMCVRAHIDGYVVFFCAVTADVIVSKCCAGYVICVYLCPSGPSESMNETANSTALVRSPARLRHKRIRASSSRAPVRSRARARASTARKTADDAAHSTYICLYVCRTRARALAYNTFIHSVRTTAASNIHADDDDDDEDDVDDSATGHRRCQHTTQTPLGS